MIQSNERGGHTIIALLGILRIDSSIEDLEWKELNENEVSHIVYSFKKDSVQDDTIEQKRRAHYNRSVRYLKSLDTRNFDI